MEPKIAVLIPCYNEVRTIGKVVRDFRKNLPGASIFVYDNNSTDGTGEAAFESGALLGFEAKQGKGNVVRRMFREIEADIYVMVDGDDTYPANRVADLIGPVKSGLADMTVGTRLDKYEPESFRGFHRFGNRMITFLINTLFGVGLRDILSGFRCFSSRYVNSIPVLSQGFEVETELTLQALDKGFIVREIPMEYYNRPEGSVSKLNTYLDGILILKTILSIFKDYRPLIFFTISGSISFLLGLGLGAVPVGEFIQTGKVTHPSTAVLASALVLVALLSFATGFILDTIRRRYRENYQLITDHIIHNIGRNHTCKDRM